MSFDNFAKPLLAAGFVVLVVALAATGLGPAWYG